MDSNYSGYTGGGYVRFVALEDEIVQFDISTADAGEHLLSIRYAFGVRRKDRPLEVAVNGDPLVFPQHPGYVDDGFLHFPKTATFNHWDDTPPFAMGLDAGINRVTLRSTGKGGPNIDCLNVTTAEGRDAQNRAKLQKREAEVIAERALKREAHVRAERAFTATQLEHERSPSASDNARRRLQTGGVATGSSFANFVIMDLDEDESAVVATTNGIPVTQSVVVLTSSAARDVVSEAELSRAALFGTFHAVGRSCMTVNQ